MIATHWCYKICCQSVTKIIIHVFSRYHIIQCASLCWVFLFEVCSVQQTFCNKRSHFTVIFCCYFSRICISRKKFWLVKTQRKWHQSTISFIILKNSKTYFENLTVFTLQDFKSIFDDFWILWIKWLNPAAHRWSAEHFTKTFTNCLSPFLSKFGIWNFIKKIIFRAPES